MRRGISRKALAVAFSVIALLLSGGGYWYYRAEADQIRQSNYENLTAIAKLKVGQIVQWRTERLYDARRAASGPALRKEALELIDHPANPGPWTDLTAIMRINLKEGMYENVSLVTPEGKLLLATQNGNIAPFSPETLKAITAATTSQQAVLSDLFLDSDGHVHLDAVGVVRDRAEKAVGVLILRCQVENYLFPLIQSWPTQSRSAETNLVQRKGEEVVVLNELRYRSKTALKLRFSLKQTDLPAVQAALGTRGIFEGIDYRHHPVFTELCAIPNSSWLMVAKVDRDEIFAEAGYRAVSTGIIVGTLILLAASAAAFAYARQRADLLSDLLKTERQQRESHERFRTILYSIGDAVFTTDNKGRVQTMNPVAERLTGWAEADANGKPLEEIFRIVNQDSRAVVDNPVTTVLRTGEVVSLANHTVLIARDGTEVSIADSAAPIRDESGAMSGVVLVVSDVSEQYRIRAALSRREREYRMLFEGMLEGFALHEIICDNSGKPIDYRFLSMNPAFEQLTGLHAAEVIGRTVREVLPEIEPIWIERYGRVALMGEPVHFEEYGSLLGRHFSVTAFRPQENQFAVVFEDITDRKAAEARIIRLTQLYAALSQCNQAIVHSACIEELLPKICRGVVEFGGMKMAWIGLIDEATDILTPAASYGSGTEYLDGLQILLNTQEPSGRGPTGTAIRENQPFWCQDFHNDPRTTPWHKRGEGYGWASSAALPLCLRGKPIGALTLYSDKKQAFDDEVQNLLVEMSNDISFALENFARRAEHSQAEKALRASEERFRNVFQQMPSVAIQGYAPDGTTRFWNEASERLYGYTAEEAVGRNLLDLIIGPEMRDETTQAMQWMAETGQVIPPGELSLMRKDGSRVPVFSSHALVKVAGGPDELFCVDVDLTESKRAEGERRLQSAALEAAANAIVITDSKGVIEWANAAFTTYTGYTAAEAVGNSPSLLKSGKHDQAFYEHLWKTVLAGEVWHGEIINRRKDGSLYSEDMTITPMRDRQGEITHFIVVKQDITERKQMEEKVLRTQRMESIGTLASGVAHDLNNILTPIILSADMLLSVKDPQIQEGLISSIAECAKRGANVVTQVLTFARGTKGERMTLELHRLVSEMDKVIRETFPRNITINSSIPSDLWLIKGDPTQIHQVLLNLCINARDAMPDGGTLLITGENARIGGNLTALAPDAKPGNYVKLTVTDNGIGIPQEIIEKIFDPFFTTKEVGKGTGLGLSTVTGIVRSHGGFITVQSDESQGSTFNVFFPRAADSVVEADPSAHPVVPRKQGETILVVDDEGLIAKVTSLLLKKNGYNTLTAAEGTEALSIYRNRQNEIKAVITDVMMPGMDGVNLARELKAINPEVKIIAFTGQATETRQAELRALGVKWILHKPFDPKNLLAALDDELRPKA